MKIVFKSRRLQKLCQTEKLLVQAYGKDCGRKIARRLTTLDGAQCLGDVPSTPPERCHPLKGDRQGEFAVDVQQPYRLVFRPNHDPIPTKEDGGVDLKRVTEIEILSIEDYH